MTKSAIIGLSIAVLLAGCAQTAWQRPGATQQELATDMAACDQYVADNGDDVAFEARLRHSTHRAHTARLIAQHHQLHAHAPSHGHGHSGGGNSGKGEAIAEGVLIVASVAVTVAQNAQLHDDCMTALGWGPGQGAPEVMLASNSPPSSGPVGPLTPSAYAVPSQFEDSGVGVRVRAASPELTRQMNSPGRIFIAAVMPNSAAAEAGLIQGDVALSYDGQSIITSDQLATAIMTMTSEGQGTISVWRAGETVDLSLSIVPDLVVN